jgi:DNA ligase-1
LKLIDLVGAWQAVRDTPSRKEKTGRLAQVLRDAGPAHVALAVAYLSGQVPQDRLGVGPALVRDARPGDAAESASLSLDEVDRALERLEACTGPGSRAARIRLLHDLLARGTAAEQTFLVHLLFGELRQGANEGVMLQAVARSAQVPLAAVRRAVMFSGNLPAVAEGAFAGGEAALARFSIELFRPIRPMLASPADTAEEALEGQSQAAVEYKMDGARIQVHKSGGDVRVFSRQLRDVTSSVPELVEVVASLPVGQIILDGETLAMDPSGRPEPFQRTMKRFGRILDVEDLRTKIPLRSYFFDCMLVDADSLIDESGAYRAQAMAAALPGSLHMPRTLAPDSATVAKVLTRARNAGHEGVMIKDLSAPYAAGSRGKAWRKLKPAWTLDLVVLAAEWGHGRRKGWLSNLHLGARDEASGEYVMLGKTFKGLTDQTLAWQTRALQEIEVARDRQTVYVEPRLVVEVAFNEVQTSPRYPAGLALRFARVKAYRPDKDAGDADTVAAVRRIHDPDLPDAVGD